MIDLKVLRELVKLMVTNDLSEVDLQDQGERVSLKRRPGGDPQVQYVTVPHPGHPVGNAASGVPANPATSTGTVPGGLPGANPGNGAAPAGVDSGLTPIKSPMVGTFYAAPNPDAKAFVALGDRVTPDTVVCIVEAMKVFNEIKAEKAGTIEKILSTSGQAVEFDQPLFLIKPA